MSLSVNILQLFYLSQDVLRGCANNKEIINLIEKWLIFFKRIFLLGYSPE